jgi:hypothetical protein
MNVDVLFFSSNKNPLPHITITGSKYLALLCAPSVGLEADCTDSRKFLYFFQGACVVVVGTGPAGKGNNAILFAVSCETSLDI